MTDMRGRRFQWTWLIVCTALLVASIVVAVFSLVCRTQWVNRLKVDHYIRSSPPATDEERIALARVKKYPTSGLAWFFYAEALEKQGEFEAAIKPLERSLSLDPLIMPGYRKLAYCYRRANPPRYEDARATYMLMLEDAWVDDHRMEAYVGFGNLLREMFWMFREPKMLDESERQLRKALELNPSYSPALVGIAKTRFAAQDNAKALSFGEKALATAKSTWDKAIALEFLANYYATLGQKSRALKLMDEARKAYPELKAGWIDSSIQAFPELKNAEEK